jgi:hypothetical protein
MRLFGALEHEPSVKHAHGMVAAMLRDDNKFRFSGLNKGRGAAACMPGTSHANADDHTEEHWRVPREDKDQRRCCF